MVYPRNRGTSRSQPRQARKIDCRGLLKRYMQHVMEEEGISYVEVASWGEQHLTKADIQELRAIEAQIMRDRELAYA